jgi:two-component system KDP operon response regulator KdpE
MNAPAIKVLVIDDEPPIRKLLRMGLSTQGYDILEASNGKLALEKLAEGPALIILDLGLPDIQGHDLLRMIRARNESVPIVVLSSRGDEAGKVQALDLGADDYLTKPFGMDELLARMRAALRHQLQVQGERPVFRSGDLSVDLVRRIVKVGEREVKLSPKEYDLLRVLVQHAGKVLCARRIDTGVKLFRRWWLRSWEALPRYEPRHNLQSWEHARSCGLGGQLIFRGGMRPRYRHLPLLSSGSKVPPRPPGRRFA